MTEKIKIEKYRNQMHVYCPYTPQSPKLCKQIDGAKWDPDRKCWKYPLEWRICLDLRKKLANPLGMDIELSPEMDAWARAEKKRISERPDPKSLELQELPRLKEVNPKLYAALQTRPFQTVGVKFGAVNRTMLLADDPGLGKTPQTIGVFEEAGVYGPIAVVAPKSAALITWPNEVKKWTERDECVVLGAHIPPAKREQTIRDAFARCEADPTLRIWIVMNTHWLRTKVELDRYGKYVRDESGAKISNANMPVLFEHPWNGVVVDEGHLFLATDTGNAKKWSQQRLGLGALNLGQDGIRLALSGTPLKGKEEKLYGTVQWLEPEVYTSYWKWAERYFEIESDGWTGGKVTGRVRDANKMYADIGCMVRRTKQEVAKDLPPKEYPGGPLDKMNPDSTWGIWLPMGKEQKAQYEAMARSSAVALENADMNSLGILAEMTRLKQFANSCMDGEMYDRKLTAKERESYFNSLRFLHKGKKPDEEIWNLVPETEPDVRYFADGKSNKIDWIMDFLEERDLTGGSATGTSKLIIASQFTGFLDLLAKRLEASGTGYYLLTGNTSDKKRVQYADEFQNNPDSAKIFILNTRAGGTSLTLDQADDVIICDETFIPDDQLQVEDRAHRLSRLDHHVSIWYLRSLGTIEESIGATNDERRKNCGALMDEARGVTVARKLLPVSGKR